jgi:protein-S-isoprenylcysteine O-methyltransferase Ste14
MQVARVVVVLVAALLGALTVVGCVIAALFELQGFGGERDADPRTAYLAALGVGLVAGIAVPLALWRVLLPDTAPSTGVLVLIMCVAVVLAALGLAGTDW